MKRYLIGLTLLFALMNTGCGDKEEDKNNFSIIGSWKVTYFWKNNAWHEAGATGGTVDYLIYLFGEDGFSTKSTYIMNERSTYTFEDMVLYIEYPSPIKYDVENQSDSTMTWSIQSSNQFIYKLKKQ